MVQQTCQIDGSYPLHPVKFIKGRSGIAPRCLGPEYALPEGCVKSGIRFHVASCLKDVFHLGQEVRHSQGQIGLVFPFVSAPELTAIGVNVRGIELVKNFQQVTQRVSTHAHIVPSEMVGMP